MNAGGHNDDAPRSDPFHNAPTLRVERHALGDGEGPLVLVGDDNGDSQIIYAACFAALGYRVLSAMTGAATILSARSALPDIVIMDLGMPDIDGLEATRQLKADARTRSAAVIVVTARGTSAFADARAAGCDAFFCKPIDPYALDDVIRTLLPEERLAEPTDVRHVFKICGCGRSYSRTTWNDLELRGYMGPSREAAVLEIRNCRCGSSIAAGASWLGSPERLVRI